MFELPEEGRERVTVDRPFVRERLKKVAEDEDLSRYIL
jgi:ATP-dependent protease HslVU (ClpYQ) ATPase subunit